MENITPILKKLRLNELDEYEPLQKYFIDKPLKLSHIAAIVLIISSLFTLFGIATRVIIGLIGAIVPIFQAINRYQVAGETYTCLPYFLILCSYITFQGWIQLIFSFIPCFNFLCLLFVIALQHPDIKLSNTLWNIVQKVL